MSSVPVLLLETLEDLDNEQLAKFHFFLYSKVLDGFTHIPKAHLQEADRPRTVNLLVQTYSDDAISVTVDVLMKMKLKHSAETLKKNYNEAPTSQGSKEIDHHAIQEKLKFTLLKKCQNVYEGNTDEGDIVHLKKIYTELHVIEEAWGGFSEEHEVSQLRPMHGTPEQTAIEARDIFKPRPHQAKQIRTVLTLGIAGVGKTVCAQRYTLSWAEGQENQDIKFLFPIPFRELNPNIGDKDCSLMQLLHQFFPEMKQVQTLGTESKVLFIFDGLDETLLPLDFKHNKVLRDETEPAPLDVLITNLLTGNLLGNALIWITSRPAAANRIHRKYIHQWTEVKGFTNEQREEYFRRRLCDDNLTTKIINHVNSSRSLNSMCQIPVFCWITFTIVTKMLHDNVTGGMPNTLTEMYVYLLLCQTDRMRDGDYPMESNNIVLKLAELAFRQLEKGKLIFYEADLKECGMDVKEATIYSGVCTQESRRGRQIFSFVHLTIQEFLAALFARHSYLQRKENVFLGYLKRMSTKWLPKSMFSFHKTAIEKALQSQNGQWDLFLRFLLGLSLKSNQELMGRILPYVAEAESEGDTIRTINFIKEKIEEEPESRLNLFHCLHELKEESLVQEIQSFMSSGRLTTKTLSPVQWSALTYELTTSESTEEFDLKKYIRSEDGVVKLLTVITSSTCALLDRCNLTENSCKVLASALNSSSCRLTELDLSDNKLKDSGVILLSVGLKSKHCKLKHLRLHNCKLVGDCCEILGDAVSTESTQLKDLDLSANNLHPGGLKALCAGLRKPNCKLETLRLNECMLNVKCCEDLASILSSDSSHLKILDLSDNSLKDSGVSLLTAALMSQHCDLETLRLSRCDLTLKCCSHFGPALSSESTHVKELDLSGNNLQGQAGIQLLCDGMRSPHCKLETLRLNECKLQKCCADLASVLSSGTSNLKELDLSENDLLDSEVDLLSGGLANPHCKLEILRLAFCGITEKSCASLASVFSSNPSHLRQLDLSYNYLQDSGVKLISAYRDNPLCKLTDLSVDPNGECYLKSTLKQNACMLTLNPNTSAKSLFLHDGGKQVTWVREKQPYPDHPDRFESVSQVLCLQGLTQRHYWEVEWRGRWVDIAVAMRGIRRRAGSHMCGFGYTDQSWSLFCSEDHYSAQHNHQRVEIPAPKSRSHRVGVYLDYPGGTLSFYSVSAGTLSHLHTFNSTFTEPLFPGFGMEEDDCSVIICTEESSQAIS
ncbi:NACHT, LRR and PYD domains-containing protein 12-like [Sphaeramia orbicularis]|uniref:NACHT, LRR and PYD domains-containing protein 12-like n=1 Tax=Sphaeramia orbicularis TaxID=375764 RepID=A0A672YEJ4_9TELE|nr:NACHT, LRR and PYD domains-containing protein 12-like [Sphaeramia orbicularis]